MNYKWILNQLNNEKYDFVKFYNAENSKDVVTIVSNVVSFGKIAVLSHQKTFEKEYHKIFDEFNFVGLKPITVILDEEEFSTERACGLFNLAEDVRAIVVADYDLFEIAAYFSTVRNIPVVNLIYEFYPKRLISKRIYIKNGNNVDSFGVDAKRHVVFMDEVFSLKSTVANAYAFAASKIVSLLDYRIRSVIISEELDKNAYAMARTAILSVLGLSQNTNDYKEKLLVNCILLEIADYITGGKLLTLSAPSISQYLYAEKFSSDSGLELASSLVIMELYDKCFSLSKPQISFAPNYIDRVETLKNISCFSEKDILKELKSQIATLNFKRKKISTFKKNLSKETSKTVKICSKIMQRYLELGGKKDYDTFLLSTAVKLSGDTPFGINGMSLVRESAIMEN